MWHWLGLPELLFHPEGGLIYIAVQAQSALRRSAGVVLRSDVSPLAQERSMGGISSPATNLALTNSSRRLSYIRHELKHTTRVETYLLDHGGRLLGGGKFNCISSSRSCVIYHVNGSNCLNHPPVGENTA